MIKAVIFDCFGVIRPDNLLLTYQRLGGDAVADRQLIEDTISAANRGMIPNSHMILAERLGVSVQTWREMLEDGVENDAELLNYAAGLRGRYKTAVLSNVAAGRLKGLIGQGELERCFDIVCESGSMGVAKPDAAAYHNVLKLLDVDAKDAVFTDDIQDYCQAAEAVGMSAVWYRSFPQFKRDFESMVAG